MKPLADLIASRLRRGGVVYICGNGGSAAESQHFAAELMGRFKRERAPIPAVSLTTDTSLITALANDYGFETVFERQVRAFMKREDVLICLSTSGKSENVVRAMKARPDGALGVAFVGKDPSVPLAMSADYVSTYEYNDPTTDVVQETHLCKLHELAGMLEEMMMAGEEAAE